MFDSFIFISKGVISRYTPEQQIEILEHYKAIGDSDYPEANKVFKNMKIRYIEGNNNDNTLFFGDSLIEQYYSKALELSKAELGNIGFLTDSGCIPIQNTFKKNWPCNNLNQLDELIQQTEFKNIVIGGHWELFLSNKSPYFIKNKEGSYAVNTSQGKIIIKGKVELFFKELVKETKNVLFILPTPMDRMFDPKVLMKNVINNDNAFKQGYAKSIFKSKSTDFYSYINGLSHRYNFTLLDPINTLCPTKICYVTDTNSAPFYKDETHLRPNYVVQKASFLDVLIDM